MTLIARPSRLQYPIIFSDILVTAEGAKEAILLPTIGVDITKQLAMRSTRLPVDLKQKTYIIRDNICISFSGNVWQIRELLKELKLFVNKYDFVGEEEIRYFFTEHYNIKEDFNRSSCLLMLVEKDEEGYINCKEFLVGNWYVTSSTHFSEIQASGSGSSQYLYDTNQDMELQSCFEENDPNLSIIKNLCFIAKTLAVERATWHSIMDHWGTGFELVVYDGKSLIKFDEIAYVVMQGEFTNDGDIGLPFPTIIMYYKYFGETLIITSLTLYNHKLKIDGDYYIMSSSDVITQSYPVYGLVRDLDELETPTPDVAPFNTHRVALGYAIRTPTEGVFAPSFTTHSKDLRVSYVPGEGVEILMKAEINTMIGKKAKEVFLKNWG